MSFLSKMNAGRLGRGIRQRGQRERERAREILWNGVRGREQRSGEKMAWVFERGQHWLM